MATISVGQCDLAAYSVYHLTHRITIL